MNKLREFLAMSVAAMCDDRLYHCGTPLTEGRTYGAIPNPDTRQLREFKIKGQTIMAYSRQDAIKRLKHQKKK